jgi:hypothetical protein
MPTVGDLVDEIQETFGSISDAQALRMIQKRDDYLNSLLPIDPSIVTLDSFVVGTREYTLSNLVAKIYSARYVRSATQGDSRMLEPTSRDELHENYGDWEGHGNAEPRMFYVRGNNIGFYPTPDTASSGGYPKVDLEVSMYATLTAATNLPDNIPRGAYDAWTFHVLEEWGAMKNDSRVDYFRLRKEEGYRQLHQYLLRRLAHYHPKMLKSQAISRGPRTL